MSCICGKHIEYRYKGKLFGWVAASHLNSKKHYIDSEKITCNAHAAGYCQSAILPLQLSSSPSITFSLSPSKG